MSLSFLPKHSKGLMFFLSGWLSPIKIAKRRQEWRRGTQECVRHGCPTIRLLPLTLHHKGGPIIGRLPALLFPHRNLGRPQRRGRTERARSGLTRGFMYAGAQRVLASLWKVDTRGRRILRRSSGIRTCGTHRERTGLPPSSAIREWRWEAKSVE